MEYRWTFPSLANYVAPQQWTIRTTLRHSVEYALSVDRDLTSLDHPSSVSLRYPVALPSSVNAPWADEAIAAVDSPSSTRASANQRQTSPVLRISSLIVVFDDDPILPADERRRWTGIAGKLIESAWRPRHWRLQCVRAEEKVISGVGIRLAEIRKMISNGGDDREESSHSEWCHE